MHKTEKCDKVIFIQRELYNVSYRMEEDDTTTPLLGQSIKDSAKIGKGDTNLSDTKFGKSQKTKKTILTLMSFIGFFALVRIRHNYHICYFRIVLSNQCRIILNNK